MDEVFCVDVCVCVVYTCVVCAYPPFFEHRNTAKNEEQFSGSFVFGPPETANQSAAVCKQFQKQFRGSLQETSISSFAPR